MALKERVQKRIDGMKVEGSWRMKLAVYGGAVLMVGGILLVMYLLLGGIGSTPQVGTVTVRSSSGAVTASKTAMTPEIRSAVPITRRR